MKAVYVLVGFVMGVIRADSDDESDQKRIKVKVIKEGKLAEGLSRWARAFTNAVESVGEESRVEATLDLGKHGHFSATFEESEPRKVKVPSRSSRSDKSRPNKVRPHQGRSSKVPRIPTRVPSMDKVHRPAARTQAEKRISPLVERGRMMLGDLQALVSAFTKATNLDANILGAIRDRSHLLGQSFVTSTLQPYLNRDCITNRCAMAANILSVPGFCHAFYPGGPDGRKLNYFWGLVESWNYAKIHNVRVICANCWEGMTDAARDKCHFLFNYIQNGPPQYQ